jgi:hypothetical protein
MSENTREIIGLVAVLLGILGYLPYLWGIFRGSNRPHAISWLVWSLVSGLGFAAQLSQNAGPGAWAIGIGSALGLLVFSLSIKYGERTITRFDWLCLILAILAILPWLLTGSPLFSVILVVVIDALGFLPTFRKSWVSPHQEHLALYVIAILKLLLSLLALREITIITALYPASLIATNTIFVSMVVWRRMQRAD